MKFKAHQFQFRIGSWFYCSGCGLILLNNDATRKAAGKSCPGKDED